MGINPICGQRAMQSMQARCQEELSSLVQMEQRKNQDSASSVSGENIQRIEKTKLGEQEKIQEKRQPSFDVKKRFDTFEYHPEMQTAGIYELSRDGEGNPVLKLDAPEENVPAATHEEGDKPQIVKTTVNTDAVDREIENLKKLLSQTKKQLSATNDVQEKSLLEKKASSLEAEIKQKDSEAYRRQHGKITEQKVVSKIGE